MEKTGKTLACILVLTTVAFLAPVGCDSNGRTGGNAPAEAGETGAEVRDAGAEVRDAALGAGDAETVIGDSEAGDPGVVEAEDLRTQVERLVEETGVPGIVVALAEGQATPIVAAAGYADVAEGLPVEPDTPFFLGSIAKNIFATILLQLVEEGALELDHPLSRYVSWPRGDEITIRMLLNHTSGIPDYLGLLARPASGGGVPNFFSSPHPPDEIYRLMPTREPIFDPGSRQRYSNTNGLLVGTVIEVVTGKSLGESLDERIAAPLGLENTFLYDQTTRHRPRARGYCGTEAWVSEPGVLGDCSLGDEALPNSADGSVVSSAPDLLRYHQALRGGALLEEESWEAMRKVEPGLDNGLGYLIMSGPMGSHEGNVGRSIGHLSANLYYLERDLFVVMLLNQGDAQLPMRRFLEMRGAGD